MNSTVEIQRVRVNRNVWKTSLTKEIINLEDNLDQIYYTAGLKPHRVVNEDAGDEVSIINNEKGISQHQLHDYEAIINEQVGEIVQAVHNICRLISSVTEFDLPIPVLVLLRLANRISSLRCQDFKDKVPGSLARKHIYYKKSLDLIDASLTLFEWISTVLSTNIISFQPFINQCLLNLLAWTRTSKLQEYNEQQYYSIRLHIVENINKSIEQLSLNINLDGKQLTALIQDELIDSAERMPATKKLQVVAKLPNSSLPTINGRDQQRLQQQRHQQQQQDTDTICALVESLKDKHACEMLVCLDRLFLVYADFLEAKLESRLKSFVIQTCIKIYRDFDQNVIGLTYRRHLLTLLETISNRPIASSTTELAWHIFELADKMESDPAIRYIARRSIKLGLAHRPIVVSHYDIHDCYANKCSSQLQINESHRVVESVEAREAAATMMVEPSESSPCAVDQNHESNSKANSDTKGDLQTRCNTGLAEESDKAKSTEVRSEEVAAAKQEAERCNTMGAEENDKVDDNGSGDVAKDDESIADEEVKSYMDLFVDTVAP